MPRTKKPPTKERLQFSIHTISLATEEIAGLHQLSEGASDFLGRSISSSAIIRALLRQIAKQGPAAADALFLEVERELKAGVIWGSKKQ